MSQYIYPKAAVQPWNITVDQTAILHSFKTWQSEGNDINIRQY